MGDRRERKTQTRHTSGHELSGGKIRGLQWQRKLKCDLEDPPRLRVCKNMLPRAELGEGLGGFLGLRGSACKHGGIFGASLPPKSHLSS